MEVVIRSAKIIDPSSPFNNQIKDILISNGVISEISDNIDTNAKEVKGEELIVSAGFVDIGANFCDPGFEYKEDLTTGSLSAAKGGYTHVALTPRTLPVIDNKSQVDYIKNFSKHSVVTLYPLGTISVGNKGEELSELYDMYRTGAIGFSDGKIALNNSELLKRALQYTKPFGAKVMIRPEDKDLAGDGLINEGPVSAKLGLKTRPAIAEEVAIANAITIAKYCETGMHFNLVSTAKGVDLIRQAKKDGLNATCDVSILQLSKTEKDLQSFDSKFKVLPPLREESDRLALIEGIKDNTITCISSNHEPQNIENKNCEFSGAAYGSAEIQTGFAVLNSDETVDLSIEEIIDRLTVGPRKVLNLDLPKIDINEKCDLAVLDLKKKWEVTESELASKSKNSAFLNQSLSGKAIMIASNGMVEIF